MIHSENNSLRHYEVTLPGEEVYKQFFDDFDKNNANDSCHTAYIKYLPSYVAACSIFSNLKTNFKLRENIKLFNDVSELKYNEEKMIARLSRQLQYLAQTQHKGVRIYGTDIKDIPHFGESLQIIENEDYLNEIKKQEDEVNVLSVDNVKENTKKWI